MAGDMIKVGGLWSNKDRDGGTFLTGKLSPGVKILIFKNKFRETENQPTHILYLAPVESQQAGQAEQEDDAFSPAPPQRYQAPEDVPPLPEEEYTTVRRSPEPMRGASSSQPRPQQPQRTRQPAPPPDYGTDDLEDPFADDAPAPARQPQGRNAGTGSRTPF